MSRPPLEIEHRIARNLPALFERVMGVEMPAVIIDDVSVAEIYQGLSPVKVFSVQLVDDLGDKVQIHFKLDDLEAVEANSQETVKLSAKPAMRRVRDLPVGTIFKPLPSLWEKILDVLHGAKPEELTLEVVGPSSDHRNSVDCKIVDDKLAEGIRLAVPGNQKVPAFSIISDPEATVKLAEVPIKEGFVLGTLETFGKLEVGDVIGWPTTTYWSEWLIVEKTSSIVTGRYQGEFNLGVSSGTEWSWELLSPLDGYYILESGGVKLSETNAEDLRWGDLEVGDELYFIDGTPAYRVITREEWERLPSGLPPALEGTVIYLKSLTNDTRASVEGVSLWNKIQGYGLIRRAQENVKLSQSTSEEIQHQIGQIFVHEINEDVIPGTQHPINYYAIIPDEEIPATDSYDVVRDEWSTRTSVTYPDVIDIEELFPRAWSKAVSWAEKIDLEVGKMKRDLLELESLRRDLKHLTPQQSKRLQTQIERRLRDLESEASVLADDYDKIRDDRIQAFAKQSATKLAYQYPEVGSKWRLLKCFMKPADRQNKGKIFEITGVTPGAIPGAIRYRYDFDTQDRYTSSTHWSEILKKKCIEEVGEESIKLSSDDIGYPEVGSEWVIAQADPVDYPSGREGETFIIDQILPGESTPIYYHMTDRPEYRCSGSLSWWKRIVEKGTIEPVGETIKLSTDFTELGGNVSDANIVYKQLTRWRYLVLLHDLKAILESTDLTPDGKITEYSEELLGGHVASRFETDVILEKLHQLPKVFSTDYGQFMFILPDGEIVRGESHEAILEQVVGSRSTPGFPGYDTLISDLGLVRVVGPGGHSVDYSIDISRNTLTPAQWSSICQLVLQARKEGRDLYLGDIRDFSSSREVPFRDITVARVSDIVSQMGVTIPGKTAGLRYYLGRRLRDVYDTWENVPEGTLYTEKRQFLSHGSVWRLDESVYVVVDSNVFESSIGKEIPRSAYFSGTIPINYYEILESESSAPVIKLSSDDEDREGLPEVGSRLISHTTWGRGREFEVVGYTRTSVEIKYSPTDIQNFSLTNARKCIRDGTWETIDLGQTSIKLSALEFSWGQSEDDVIPVKLAEESLKYPWVMDYYESQIIYESRPSRDITLLVEAQNDTSWTWTVMSHGQVLVDGEVSSIQGPAWGQHLAEVAFERLSLLARSEDRAKISAPRRWTKVDHELKCPKCERPMVFKSDGRFGPFYGCSGYPAHCTHIINAGYNGEPLNVELPPWELKKQISKKFDQWSRDYSTVEDAIQTLAEKSGLTFQDINDIHEQFSDVPVWKLMKVLDAFEPEQIKLSTDLYSTIDQPKSTLDPEIWDGSKLRPEIREVILSRLVDGLSQYFQYPEKWLAKISLIGSETSRQWTEDADLDVQVLIDVDTFLLYEEIP